jgi:putative ABC transport system ATP-binding protein
MTNPLIRIDDLTKIYQLGEVSIHALNRINLQVFPGEMVAVQGASGSGKSTLMNIVGCLDRPTSGKYFLEDRDISGLTPNELAHIRNQTIGFVFQGFNLLNRTSAVENVELPLLYSGTSSRKSRELAIEALTSLGLGDRIHHLPNQLSGGQQQRVAICRALVSKPRMILADEPTGNLDTATSLDVMAIFQDLNAQGITVILITHEFDISQYAKRIVLLKDGRIIKDEAIQPRNAKADRKALMEERNEAA